MNTYNFYGWEQADVLPVNKEYRIIRTPKDLYDILSEIWSAETCAPRLRGCWTPENRTLGQCSITSFLVQDIYGGKVYGVPLEEGGYHCFNVVNGRCFDLTSEQFGGKKLIYNLQHEQLREMHFADEEKEHRYELLKQGVLDWIFRHTEISGFEYQMNLSLGYDDDEAWEMAHLRK